MNDLSNENNHLTEIDDDLYFEALSKHSLLSLFEEDSFKEKWHRVFEGLRKPKDSGHYRWSLYQLQRLLAPVMAIVVPFLFLGLINLLASFAPEPSTSIQVRVVEQEAMETLEDIEIEEFVPQETIDPIDIQMDFSSDAVSLPTETVTTPMDSASVAPADFDSVAMVRSPVMMRGMLGSRNPGMRGSAVSRYGGQWGAQS